MLTLDKIYHAKFVLKQVARKTDLIAATRLCPGTDLYLKTENLQVTGSFKVRGAYYKISQLSAEERAKGVIACSAGNHAQGVALAATRMGIKSVVCMPDGAPIMKVESTKRLGAEVELVKGTYDDAHDRAVELQEQTGMTFIHPYDDELVIAGQGTIGLEILDQLPDVDAVIVPIGGGGLISGVAFAIKSLRPEVKIYGVQAAGAPSMEHAFHDHKYETLDSAVTFADGIAVKTPGETTFDMVSQYVDEIVTVSEDEIAAAILALLEVQKTVAEGAGATPVAACMSGKVDTTKKTVCVVSGGNVDVTGLIVACDILEQLPQDLSGVMLFVPKLMFNADGMTLDEYHRDDLLASLTSRGAEVHVVSTMPHELLDTLEHILGIVPADSNISTDPTH